jgi:endonuclease YncB( thermonuclease family)
MQMLLPFMMTAGAVAAMLFPPVKQSESVLVRAVIDGGTIDVAQVGRVRLLGIEIPAPVAERAHERLAGLLLNRWVRLETEAAAATQRRRAAYVVTEDGVCANTVLVREGLARVAPRAPRTRLEELRRAELDAQRLEKGMWGYTRRPQPQKRRSS